MSYLTLSQFLEQKSGNLTPELAQVIETIGNTCKAIDQLLQKGALQKDELGLIEVQDFSSYAAVKRNKINSTLNLIKGEKLKNKKVRIEISR